MTTLVTGASGFLGSHVARLLIERGEHVRVLVRPTSSRRLLEGLCRRMRAVGDLRDPASFDRAMQGVAVVYHVAADYRLWARNPARSTNPMLQGRGTCSMRHGAPAFPGSSTPARWRRWPCPQDGGLPDESTITSVDEMIGDYKRSKWLAEQEVQRAAAAGLPVVIVNPTTPVGPGDAKPTPTGRIIRGFFEWPHAGLRGCGIEFCPGGRCRGGSSAGGRARARRRALHSGR